MRATSGGQRQGFYLRTALLALAGICLVGAGPASAFRAEPQADPGLQRRAPAPPLSVQAPSPAQALLAEQARESGIKVRWNDSLGTPRSVRGMNLGAPSPHFKARLAAAAGPSPERKAIAVLDNLAGLYALADAEAELAPKTTLADALGFQHVKLTQVYRGLRVVGGELIVHFNARGEAYEVNGQYIAAIELDAHPALQAGEAAAAAQRDLGAAGNPAGAIIQGPELVVYAFNSQPRLAYEMTIQAAPRDQVPGRWRYWVDAHNGEIIQRFNDIKSIAFPSAGLVTNVSGSLLTGEGGGATNIAGWYNTVNTSFYLYSPTCHWIISNAAASGYTDSLSYAYRGTTNWGISDRAEMSAANNFHKIQQYFSNFHGRGSFDDAGALATARIHYGVHYANAYWDGQDFTFGDGDGSQFNELTVLDVAGHEFTHAVTEYSADLYYGYVDSGALNESFSDIFGTCVEYHSQPDSSALYPSSTNGCFDWLVGEDAVRLPYRALRDLRNPSGILLAEGRHPTRFHGTYWDSSGEMHYNSTVHSFMFYLLCEGGSGDNDGLPYNVTGISLTNAEQIAYRTLTVYLTPYARYADAQDAWQSAANDLNPNWVANVVQAWAAVGFSDRESGELGIAVNATNCTWYTGGNTNWFAESTTTHDGELAAQSGAITDDQMTKMYTTVTGPATVSFWWKVSCESNYDFLAFTINGIQQTKITGEVDWQFQSHTLSNGAYILKWDYAKDELYSVGEDAGWLDEVSIRIALVIAASSGTHADRIAVSWNPQSDATAYELWRAQGSADTNLAVNLTGTGTTATNYDDTAAVPGVLYYYWAKAQTPSGTTDFHYVASGWRSWQFIPAGVSASAGAYTNKIHLSWTAAPGAVSYRIYRNTTAADSGALAIGSTADTTHDDTGATAGIVYYYWVKGVDASGAESGFSQPASGWVMPMPEPPDPDSTNTPALRATDFQMTPAMIQIGSYPAYLAVRMVNTVPAATSAWVTLTAYLSASGVFGGADNFCMGSLQRYVSLAAEQSSVLLLNSAERARLRAPNSLALGYYTMFLQATTTRPQSTNNIVTLAGAVQIIASHLADRDDFDGDGKSDLVIYNASTGVWTIRSSATGQITSFVCGGPGYAPVSGDFDGDNKSDLAAYQPSTGAWLFKLSASLYRSVQLDDFGSSGYVAAAGDFDGDGKSDPAIYHPGTGVWIAKLSGSAYAEGSAILGDGGCLPVCGDYDGDGKFDPAVYDAASGEWQALLSGNNYALAAASLGPAGAGCVPVAGDFDGDLKSDPGIYQEEIGYWAVMLSASGHATATAKFGETGCLQTSGDFDGDGKTDLTVYQSGYGNWYFRLSKSGYPLSSLHFGGLDFTPVAAWR